MSNQLELPLENDEDIKYYWVYNGEKYEVSSEYLAELKKVIPKDVKLYDKVKD